MVSSKEHKKNKGQFYTTQAEYILEGLPTPLDSEVRASGIRCIIEPFAGQGDLLTWLERFPCSLPIEAYDIEPKKEEILQRDTLLSPPNYKDAWVLTNPPYLARNKSDAKEVFDVYDTNDLYKCFLTSLVKGECKGGIVIIPAGFFFSPRDIDVRCRHEFMSKYKILKVKYFEETVFEDTTTTIVAVSFEKSPTPLTEQWVEWEMLPSKEKRVFPMCSTYDWIIGGDIYHIPVPTGIKVRRHVEGQKLRVQEQQTYMTLNALDSGTREGRISLQYKKDYVYPAKECSRTYATLRITGKILSEEEQIQLCTRFNAYIEEKRKDTWSLFLPQFRESKEYARKRIPFELAYRILLHLL